MLPLKVYPCLVEFTHAKGGGSLIGTFEAFEPLLHQMSPAPSAGARDWLDPCHRS